MNMIPKPNIQFLMYCITCGADLKYDPELNSNPIFAAEVHKVQTSRKVFELDLSWHYCKCDMSEGEEPDYVVKLV